jgi:uncharacterized membrane protein
MTEPGRPPGKPETGSDLAGTRRTEAFSDGVFAIVITLLVLDLASPEYRPGGLGAALTRQWPSYLAFAVSFVYVGVIWLNHHALFRRIRRLDLGLNWINLGVLLGAVIIPFPTAVIASAFARGNGNDERTAVVLYAVAALSCPAPGSPPSATSVITQGCWNPARRPNTPGSSSPGRSRASRCMSSAAWAGWFIDPVAGLVSSILMIIYHAVTSEGLREGSLGRLIWRREQN